MLKNIFLNIITFYKKALSPYLGGQCKYYPSCSSYGYIAIEQYGVFKGIYLITFRLMKCNPWSKGGYDPLV